MSKDTAHPSRPINAYFRACGGHCLGRVVNTIYRKNSSSPESCNDRACSTSQGEMTSVRTCYCKEEASAHREKDNDIRRHSRNRHPTIIASRKSFMSKSVEVQPPDPVLSPETTNALENAEKIINDAKIHLMEIRAMPNPDSVRCNKDTYSDDPPLDDEAEELLYIRELVASRFQEACSGLAASGKGSSRSEEQSRRNARITARRVDLSAPKFQTSQRRHVHCASLGHDQRQLEGRAPPAEGAPPKDSASKEPAAEDGTAVRDDDRPTSPSTARAANGSNACRIQIGPSVHVDGEILTRQDLEDVHISPEQWTHRRANTGTYILRHESVVEEKRTEGTRPKGIVRRATTVLREKYASPSVVESSLGTDVSRIAEGEVQDAVEDKNSDHVEQNGRGGSLRSRVQDHVDGEEKDGQQSSSQDDARTLERNSERVTDREAIDSTIIKNARPVSGERAEINCHDSAMNHYMGDNGIFNKRHAVDDRPDRPQREEDTAGKTQGDNRGDQSKPSLAGDVSRKTSFPRRENMAPRGRATPESAKAYRAIDECPASTFLRDDVRDEPREELVAKEIHYRPSVPVRSGGPWTKDDLDVHVELYRPRLHDLDSLLLSNDRKIERAVRAARAFAESLLKPEFARYKLDEVERAMPRCVNRRKESSDRSAVDKNRKRNPPSESSSVVEDELRNQDLTVWSASESRRVDAEGSRGLSTDTMGKSTKEGSAKEYSCRSGSYTKNHSVASTVGYPASDASDAFGMSRPGDEDETQRLKARLSGSSDITAFSNIPPALSSTRTETQTRRRQQEKQIAGANGTFDDRYADARRRAVPANKFSGGKIDRSPRGRADDVFARVLRGSKDEAATDRFVAYILQDEKQSIERKVANALKESAITPAAVQKLLDHVREAGSARRTETLDILKNILINVRNHSETADASDGGEEAHCSNSADFSARTNASPPSEIEQAAENSQKNSDERSTNFPERRETRESAGSAGGSKSIPNSRSNSKSEQNTRQTLGILEIPKSVPINVENQTGKIVYDENAKDKDDQDVPSTRTDVPFDAIDQLKREEGAKINASEMEFIVEDSRDFELRHDEPNHLSDFAECPETRESIRSANRSKLTPSSKSNSRSKEISYSEGESLKQISDIRSDGKESSTEGRKPSTIKIVSVKSNEIPKTQADDPDVIISADKATSNEKRGYDAGDKDSTPKAQSTSKNIARKAADETLNDTLSDIPGKTLDVAKDTEVAIGKSRDGLAPANEESSSLANVPGIKDEGVQSGAIELIDETPARKETSLLQSPAERSTESPRGSEKDVDPAPHLALLKDGKIDPANSHSVDPPPDPLRARNATGEPLSKKTGSSYEDTSLDIAGEDAPKRSAKGEESHGRTIPAMENRGDGNALLGLAKSAKDVSEERPIVLASTPRKSSSNSESDISSIPHDHDTRSNSGASTIANKIGTSPETSHSEGELYMPSSCSYSLGEVKVLEKRDLIADRAIDRDSSVTFLVTRSMLTSLNDSATSSLASSGRI